MIQALLILTILIWPFGQLLSFTLPQLSFTLYLLDLVTIFLTISLFISKDRKKIFSTPLTKPLAIFLGLSVISLTVNVHQVISAGVLQTLFYTLRLFVYPSIYFAAKYTGYRKISRYLIISAIIFSLLGLIQYFIFPDMRYLKNLGFDDHYYRLIGSLYDPNYTGAIFCCVSLFFIAKKKYLISLPFMGLLALTFSRASYLGFVVGLIYVLVSQKRYKLFLLLAFLGILIYLIPKPFGEGVNLARTFSIFSRLQSWQQGANLFLSKPVFGWGYNTLRGADGSRFAIDNSYLYLLATTGILGFCAYLNILVKGFKQLSIAAQTALVSLLTHAFFNNSLLYIWLTASLWLLLSLPREKLGSVD